MDSDFCYQGEQKGCRQKGAAEIIHQHAQDQQEKVDHQQYRDSIRGKTRQRGDEALRHVFHNIHTTEHHHEKDHHNDHSGRCDGVDQRVSELPQVHGAVNKKSHQHRIDHRNRRGLGGREYTAQNSIEDDYGE